MIDTRHYIASGALESYILGVASPQEKKEVECLSDIYPEIQKELNGLHSSFAEFISAGQVEPPRRVREALLKDIEKLEHHEKLEAKVLAMVSGPEEEHHNPFIYWVAAAAVLIIITGFYFFNSKLGENEKSLSAMRGELASARAETAQLAATQKELNDQLAILKNPDNRLVALKGTETHASASALVCWNRLTQQVYLCSQNMPAHPADKQYQLWAIVGGKPVDLGVLDPARLSQGLVSAGTVQDAQAFAITLEEKGGSRTPHLDQLFVIGNV